MMIPPPRRAGRARERLIAGCMTGTSIDALDVALVAVRDAGLRLTPRWLAGHAQPIPASMRERLRRLARQEPLTAGQIARLQHDFALLHVKALRALCGRQRPALIAIHGQTVYHAPPLSWQMLHAPLIAARCGAPVVFDLRAADLAAGGEGAPITPLADYFFFAAPREPRIILNLGGFANFTWLPARGASAKSDLRKVAGGDICVCNQLLDEAARRLLGTPLDRDGRQAERGAADPRLTASLARRLNAQARSGRSLGTTHELFSWLHEHAHARRRSAQDVLRSICAAIAGVIAARLPTTGRALLAGGGVRNRALRDELERRLPLPCALADEAGLPSSFREAADMAVLGALCADGVPITLPRVTGVPAPAPRAGVWALPGRVAANQTHTDFRP